MLKTEQVVNKIIEALEDNKAHRIVKIDLRKIENCFCSFFVKCHGTSGTHIAGLTDAVEEKVREDLVTTYLKIRYCTKEIAALWYGDGQLTEWTLFGRLQSFSYKTRFSYPYTVNSDLLTRCLTFTCKTEKVIKKFCKERIKFLETLSKSRENSQEEKSDLSKE